MCGGSAIVHPVSSETTLVDNMAVMEPSLATVEIRGGAMGEVYLRTADSIHRRHHLLGLTGPD